MEQITKTLVIKPAIFKTSRKGEDLLNPHTFHIKCNTYSNYNFHQKSFATWSAGKHKYNGSVI